MPEVQLLDSERQPCEIWSRVMGYHRPTSGYNPGKRCEHAQRKMFTERLAVRAGLIERTAQ